MLMTLRRFAFLAFASACLSGLLLGTVAPAFAEGTTATATVDAPAKPKKVKVRKALKPSAPTPAEQAEAPLQLNFDPLKSVILKPEPSARYQSGSPVPPQVASRADDQQAHLAPLLRETSLPDSFGDKGNFFERHEFGIQLKDHF
jgi:hypothetical protein